MANVAISASPDYRVSGLTAPQRDGNGVKFSWNKPAAATNSSNRRRAEWCDIYVRILTLEDRGPVPRRERWAGKPEVNYPSEVEIWWRGYGPNWTSGRQGYDRTKYYPFTKKHMYLISLTAWYGNWVGWGAGQYTKMELGLPRKPVLEAPAVSSETQNVSCRITTNAGSDRFERYDTRYCCTRRDNYTAAWRSPKIITNGGKWAETQSTDFTATIAIGDSARLTESQWIELVFKAYARGLRGDSAIVTRTKILAQPPQPTITSISAPSASGNSVLGNAVITIRCKSNQSTYHPVDEMSVEHLVTDHTVTSAAVASTMQGWSSAANGAKDNGNGLGFSETVADSGIQIFDANGRPTGQRLWYRIRSKYDSYERVSVPVQATSLYRAPLNAENDWCNIESLVSGSDGTSIKATFTWTQAGGDESEGVEVSYSEDEDAWESTQPPSTYKVSDKEHKVSGQYKSSIVVKGLEEGVKYFFRARRYGTDANGNEAFGRYSQKYTSTPVYSPENVQVSAPSYIPVGRPLPVSWTFDGTMQSAWTVYAIDPENNATVLASGNDASGSTTIPAGKLTGTEVHLAVGVSSTGSELAYSSPISGTSAYSSAEVVHISAVPTVTVDMPDTLTAQPASFSIISSDQDARVIAKVFSMGASTDRPDGQKIQLYGECVWSDSLIPVYDSPDGVDGYSATIALPTGVDFIDGTTYHLVVSVLNETSGLVSDEVDVPFSIDWAVKAVVPSSSTRINGLVESKYAKIVPVAGPGSAETDVCDIYRVTPDGVYAIASEITFGSTVIDRFAPFSKTAILTYRIASRTLDGSVAWIDLQYNIDGYQMRFDWGSGSAMENVELPYNLKVSDSYSKDFQERVHLSGERAGRWNRGVHRAVSLQTTVIRLADPEVIAKIKSLARYTGPVFVRTPDGAAYSANVDVTDIPNSYDSLVMDISLSATEIRLADEHKVATTDIELPAAE